ncbi:MAG: hypothetical protein V4598_13850 [Bdellovibrionota bacterium]
MDPRKINPDATNVDTCQKSLDWLRVEVTEWLRTNVPDHGIIWFADNNSTLVSGFPAETAKVEIIFTGSFFLRFLESGLWPFKDQRIWVLSQRVKDIFVHLFGMPEEEIGIIGRPIKKEVPRGQNFVYAGRLSFTKNIPGLLHFISELQRISPDATLDIFGEFDAFPDESLGRFSPFSLKDHVTSLMAKLHWTSRPVFHGEVAQIDWPQVKRQNPSFISFTTLMYEDYGTAVEIATRKNWPALVSDWGGHAEASGHHIPVSLLPEAFMPEEIQALKAKRIVTQFLDGKFSFRSNDPAFIPTTCKSLQKARNEFMAKAVPEIFLCFREEMSLFADTPKGQRIFRSYRQLMAGGDHE